MTLQELPTSALLAEIQRRCNIAVPGLPVLRVPSWAMGVIERVSASEDITPQELLENQTRTNSAALPRMMAMAALEYLYPSRALEEIAHIWKKDHGTVIHARNKISALVATECGMAQKWKIAIGQETPHGRGHPRRAGLRTN